MMKMKRGAAFAPGEALLLAGVILLRSTLEAVADDAGSLFEANVGLKPLVLSGLIELTDRLKVRLLCSIKVFFASGVSNTLSHEISTDI